MSTLVNNNLAKIIAVVIALVILGAGFCSMAAMEHNADSAMTSAGMAQKTDCESSQESQSCVNFHFGLLEQFSHGFTNTFVLKLFTILLTLSVLFFVAKNLSEELQKQYRAVRVRLRRLKDETISIFQDTLGYWLSLFEKRDPNLYAFVIA